MQRPNKDKTYEPALACLQSLFMITIRDHGSSQPIRPEDTASGLVMGQLQKICSGRKPWRETDNMVREVLQPPESPKKPNASEICGAGSHEPGAATCHHETPTGYGESLTTW